MTRPRLAWLALGILAAILLWSIWAIIIDEKCSRNLSELDPTWEEMTSVPRPAR